MNSNTEAGAEYRKTATVTARQVDGTEDVPVYSLEGPATARPGDYIVTATTGESWVVAGGIFESTYEPVTPSDPLVAAQPGDEDEGYDEFVVDEHLTTPVTLVRARRVIDEPPPHGEGAYRPLYDVLRGRTHRHIAELFTNEMQLAPDVRAAVDAALVYERTRTADEIAALRYELDDQRAAKQTAGGYLDRFRDVLSEALGHPDENPGDDVLVAELREHFGKTGPEPTRWRDFITGATAIKDQINAERKAGRG